MLNTIVKTFNTAFDSTAGRIPVLGKHLTALTPKTQKGGGCPCASSTSGSSLIGGYKYSKKASLARSRRMTKRIKARSLKSKKRTKSRKRGRGKGRGKSKRR